MAGARILFAAALLSLLLAAGGAGAHQVKLFAYVEGGRLLGEGYLPGGGKIKNQPLEVYDADGRLLAQARTDDQGAFSLPLPPGKPPLKLVLKAGPGHQAQYELGAAELAGAGDASAKAEPKAGVSLRDVIYGLGWIVVLLGLATYIRNLVKRRKRR